MKYNNINQIVYKFGISMSIIQRMGLFCSTEIIWITIQSDFRIFP